MILQALVMRGCVSVRVDVLSTKRRKRIRPGYTNLWRSSGALSPNMRHRQTSLEVGSFDCIALMICPSGFGSPERRSESHNAATLGKINVCRGERLKSLGAAFTKVEESLRKPAKNAASRLLPVGRFACRIHMRVWGSYQTPLSFDRPKIDQRLREASATFSLEIEIAEVTYSAVRQILDALTTSVCQAGRITLPITSVSKIRIACQRSSAQASVKRDFSFERLQDPVRAH